MKYISGHTRDQITFLPNTVEDFVADDNHTRVIDAFVNGLDVSNLGFERAKPEVTGRPGYDPRDMLKLYIYGYFNKIRSSRKLATECCRNLEVMYLINKLTPDFRVISDFRKDNAKPIKSVFKVFVRLCIDLKLYGRELAAIDGSKFRAVNHKDKCFNQEILEKKLTNIDKHIDEYIKYMDENDKTESIDEVKSEQIKETIKNLQSRKITYTHYLETLKTSGESQLLLTDPDARRMHSKDGFHCSYNVQTAVDNKHHMIAEFDVTNKNDMGQAKQFTDKVKETLKVDTIETLLDKGYDSNADVLNCLMNGTIANAAIKEDKDERLFTIEYKEAEITEEIKQSTKPEDIQKCLHAGVLPTCYENKNIKIEYQDNETQSYFKLNDNGTVTCPMEQTLRALRKKGAQTYYGSKAACRFCPNKCTVGKNKVVAFGPDAKYVPIVMNNHPKLPKLPPDTKLPNNFTKKNNKQVLIRMKHTYEMTVERMGLAEHPFGTIKWHLGFHYFLCRGFTKVTAEMSFACLAYNLRRAINVLGTKEILKRIAVFACIYYIFATKLKFPNIK